MLIQEYFDKIYVLNLKKRTEKLDLISNRLESLDIPFEIFNAVDGSVMKKIWYVFKETSPYFANPNYLATAISHLSIYKDAIEKNYNRILILEDDVKIHKDINNIFSNMISKIPEDWELLYLGYIPLSDDCQYWDYNIINNRYINDIVFWAKNLWGMYSYGISRELMDNIIDIYDKNFPMELDRYYVLNTQQQKKCLGTSPQLFCVDDIKSDNLGYDQPGMIERSVDVRYSKHEDYI